MRIPLLRLESHSSSRLYAHLVWSTRSRCPRLQPERDAWLESILTQAAHGVGCGMLAAGNAADHVHVVVCFPPRLSVAEPLRWQVGYHAESVGHGSLTGLTRYVKDQRKHHASSSVRDEWELPSDQDLQR